MLLILDNVYVCTKYRAVRRTDFVEIAEIDEINCNF